MKRKASTPPAPIKMTAAEASVISNALDFMSHYEGADFTKVKFTHENVTNAAWKVDSMDTEYTRGEIRAMSAAIDLALHCLHEDPEAISQVAQEFPDLIPDLQDSLPALELLRTRFHAYVARLAKGK